MLKGVCVWENTVDLIGFFMLENENSQQSSTMIICVYFKGESNEYC